jgi:hypothetical protein
MQATGTYEIKGWDEQTWEGKNWKEQAGAKLTHAKITQAFHGDIEGEAAVQYLMAYRDDTYATYVGLMQISGRIGERSGSFVAKIEGVFENGAATSTWSILPGSGAGELQGLRGEGKTVAHHGSTQPFTLDYHFD